MVINAWDQMKLFGGDRILISYIARHSVLPGRWCVTRLIDGRRVVTDKTAAWYDHGSKTFNVIGGKAEGLQLALKWVEKTYGKKDFVRNRSGDYVERAVNEKFPIEKREKLK